MTAFSGIIPPLVTPIKSYDKLDVDAVDRVIDHVVDGGVSGIFVLGTTGEGPSLTYPMRYEMVERACSVAEGRVPVLVGVTDCSFAESLYLAEHAASCVASAIVAAAPFYFGVSQASIVDWFGKLADETALPLMLYNMPSCVGIHLEPDSVAQLASHPNIVGIKDSSGDLTYFRTLCQRFGGRGDFSVI
ncbi:MAG: dihydrodipicolinate synthase family protein, partial [Planctomycetales bacterium]|nr:dihydrodipicolinate synthase family protein [Planctomycetales bacterium]